MSKVRVIAEMGSTHNSKLSYIKEAIDRCKDNGIDALKLQLFPDEAPYVPTNIHLPQTLFLKAFEYGDKVGLPISASVFDLASLGFLVRMEPEFIKLAFSKKDNTEWGNEIIRLGIELIVSCDVMTEHLVPKEATKLYCIPEYPVRYEVAFDGLFGKRKIERKIEHKVYADGCFTNDGSYYIGNETPRFDGFSDHTLGMRQTFRAVGAGAKIIEKHVTLPHSDITCPDSFFAVSIEELGELKK